MKTGLKNVATRINNASEKFIANAVEQFGITKEQAEKVLTLYRKHKLVKLDAVNGTYDLKFGQLWELKTILGAANS